MALADKHELILWQGGLYRRVDASEHAAERAGRDLTESDLVATEDLHVDGLVVKAGEVIPPPSLTPGAPLSIAVYLPAPADDHDRLVETGQARRVTNVDKLFRRRRAA